MAEKKVGGCLVCTAYFDGDAVSAERQAHAMETPLPGHHPQAKQAEAAAAAAQTKAAKPALAALEDDATEEADPTKYHENRCAGLLAFSCEGLPPGRAALRSPARPARGP